jgi:CTP:molybdopterin cytidylyltransferase MocA
MPTTAALILAAGLGTRFGGQKLLAPIGRKPMLQRVLDLCADAELAPVIVVLGADADQIESTMSWRSELRVHNPSPERGLAQSVRLGMWTLARLQHVHRAAVLLGDQPLLTLQQLRTIVGARGQIVVPRYDGKPGNPVVLDRSVWTLAAGLEGDRGFSQLFSAYPNLVSFVDVAGSNPDIDTPDDLVTGYFG